MMIRVEKIEGPGRVALIARISGRALPHVWEMSKSEFDQLKDWKRAIRDDYERELRERAALAGPDVFEIVKQSIAFGNVCRTTMAACLIVALALCVCAVDSPVGRGSTIVADDLPITDFVADRSGAEDARLAFFFNDRAIAHDSGAIPKAILYARRQVETKRGAERAATLAARDLLGAFTDAERRAACVQFASTVGWTPDALIKRMDEVFSE